VRLTLARYDVLVAAAKARGMLATDLLARLAADTLDSAEIVDAVLGDSRSAEHPIGGDRDREGDGK
jgi:hypothetical protein